MASLVVRNLDDAIKEALVARAQENGRSMEAEVRAILIDVVQPKNIGIALYEASR
ncbi:FitA-like ribbon-helix-helix domain-containing protein, partial [Corynebacterium striatum]